MSRKRTMPLDEVAELVAGMAEAMYDALLIWSEAPKHKEYMTALQAPAPGHMVVEVSTRGYPVGDARMLRKGWKQWRGALDRVGTLLRVETMEREHGDGERYPVTLHVIRTLDGWEIAWENCRFIRVFTEELESSQGSVRRASPSPPQIGHTAVSAPPSSSR